MFHMTLINMTVLTYYAGVDKEKTSFNVPQTVFPICMTRTKFMGADLFSTKNLVWGTKIFRTKIPVTVLILKPGIGRQ